MYDGMVLYHYWRSSCSWRVRWALTYKNIPHRLIAVDLLKGEQKHSEYLKKNPAGFVPLLEYRGMYFSESLAMLEFLEEAFPQKPLLPNDPLSRMKVRQLSMSIIAGTQPLQNLEVLNYVSSDAGKKKDFASYFIRRGLKKYEAMIETFSGTYSFGSQLTFADLALIPQCYNALRNEIDLEEFPRVVKIYKHCLQTGSCQKSAPENYKPAVDF